MSLSEEYEKDKARRIARGEPLHNEEVVQAMESAKQHIKARAARETSDEAQPIARDIANVLEKGQEFLQTKNKGEEIQNIQVSMQKLATAAAHADVDTEKYFTRAQKRYERIKSLVREMMTSKTMRRTVRRMNRLVLQALSSGAGKVMEELKEEQKRPTEDQQRKYAEVARKREPEEPQRSDEEEGELAGAEFPENKLLFKDTEHTRKDFKVVVLGKEYGFLDEDLTDDQKKAFAEELQNVLRDVSEDDNLRDSFSNLLMILRDMRDEMGSVNRKQLSAEVVRTTEEIRQNFISLLDNMVEGYSFAHLGDAWRDLQDKTEHDHELRGDWQDMLNFLDESVRNERLVSSESWKRMLLKRMDHARTHLLKIRPYLFRVIQELDEMLQHSKEDRVLQESAQAIRQLGEDLFYDEKGNLKFRAETLNTIRNLIIPELQTQFKYIALPTISNKDDDMEYEISNAVLKTAGITPDEVTVTNSNHLHVDPAAKQFRSSVHVMIRGVRLEAQDVHLRYKRFSFPKLSDEGVFNVKVDGGMNLEAWLSSRDDQTFRVDDVDCTLSGFALYDMDFEKHETLYSVFKPIIEYILRKRAETAIEDKLKSSEYDLKALSGSATSILS